MNYSWSGLPAGCASLDAAVVTCVPETAGTYTVGVTVTDAVGAHASAAEVRVTVTKASAVVTGLSSGLDWGILGLAVGALVIAVVGVLWMRRRGGGKREGQVAPLGADASSSMGGSAASAGEGGGKSPRGPGPESGEGEMADGGRESE